MRKLLLLLLFVLSSSFYVYSQTPNTVKYRISKGNYTEIKNIKKERESEFIKAAKQNGINIQKINDVPVVAQSTSKTSTRMPQMNVDENGYIKPYGSSSDPNEADKQNKAIQNQRTFDKYQKQQKLKEDVEKLSELKDKAQVIQDKITQGTATEIEKKFLNNIRIEMTPLETEIDYLKQNGDIPHRNTTFLIWFGIALSIIVILFYVVYNIGSINKRKS